MLAISKEEKPSISKETSSRRNMSIRQSDERKMVLETNYTCSYNFINKKFILNKSFYTEIIEKDVHFTWLYT